MAKVFVIIPSRWGSSRFPGKPLAPILGMPMVEHVYKRALKIETVDQVFIATDDNTIYKTVTNFGGQAIMTSPKHLSGSDRLAEAAKILNLADEDIVINVQGDQPAFNPSHPFKLAQELKNDPNLQMATLSTLMGCPKEAENPNLVKVIVDNNDMALYFSRSPIPFFRDKDIKQVYYRHIGIYAYRVSFLNHFITLKQGILEKIESLEQLRALENGIKIKVIKVNSLSPEVDVPEDINRVEKELLKEL